MKGQAEGKRASNEANLLQLFTLQPGPAPGRDNPGTPPATPPPAATGTPGTPSQAPADHAPASGQAGGGGLFGNMVVMAPLLLMVVVLFFLSRADKKKRQQVESTLKKGDRVVTRAGLIGKLTELSERTVRLEIAPGVHVTILKNAIEGLDGGDTVTSTKKLEEAKDDKAKDKDKDKEKEPPAESKKKK